MVYGVYLVDGSSVAFAVTPGDVVRYNIPASHPLRIYGQESGCDPTWVAVDGTTSGSPDHHRGLWELTYPSNPSCYPLTLYCQYHGVMGSNDRILAATPPSPSSALRSWASASSHSAARALSHGKAQGEGEG